MQGSPVNISLFTADASAVAGVPLVLTDCNGDSVTLGPREILLIDCLAGFSAMAGTNKVQVFFDANANNADDAPKESIFTFAGLAAFVQFPDGRPSKMGLLPRATSTTIGRVEITGVGRIITGASSTARPSWRE